jgi:hypothetical protein
VINHGAVVTSGPNDMVLDNWGDVDGWIAEGRITSYGPSGIGFVNFGTTRSFHALQPIETFGRGARGFNAYDGLIETAEFERIETHADAGVGIQISRPVTHLIMHGGITTHGGVGESLVKGVIQQLPAYGLSVQPGAIVEEMLIDRGGITTEGDDVVSVQVQGEIDVLQVRNGIHASGQESDAMQVEGGSVGLSHLGLTATHGVALRYHGEAKSHGTGRPLPPSRWGSRNSLQTIPQLFVVRDPHDQRDDSQEAPRHIRCLDRSDPGRYRW